jgi:hypothetical protein
MATEKMDTDQYEESQRHGMVHDFGCGLFVQVRNLCELVVREGWLIFAAALRAVLRGSECSPATFTSCLR